MKQINIYLAFIVVTLFIQSIICAKSKDILTNITIPIISLIIVVYVNIALNNSTGYDVNYYSYVKDIFILVLLASAIPIIVKLIIKLKKGEKYE